MKYKFHWLNPKLKPQKANERGFGLFAKQDIAKDELLIVFGGYVLPLKEEEKLPGKLSDNGVQISEDLSLCVVKLEEYAGHNFLNHSCEPNAGFRGQIFIKAIKKIKEGDEVAIDYAMVLYHSKNAPPYHLECKCGKKKCRGIITDNDWKKPELQTKYDGYFQYFIQEKINKNRK